MQNKFLLASAALAGSSVASPLNLLGRQIAGYGTPTTTPAAIHASFTPHASVSAYPARVSAEPAHISIAPPTGTGVPHSNETITDGYGSLYPGETSLIFCPVSKTVRIQSCPDRPGAAPQRIEQKLACPKNGAEYEFVGTDGGPNLMVHGGNLCTSNIVQYYLWSSRMYDNMWALWGAMPLDIGASEHCDIANGEGGQVYRCVVPSSPGEIQVDAASFNETASYSHAPVASYTPSRSTPVVHASQAPVYAPSAGTTFSVLHPSATATATPAGY